MRFNKKLQYGILLCLYLSRAGRASLHEIAGGLGLSRSFLDQVARKMRQYGIITSVRGRLGGYELVGDPKIDSIFTALSPVVLLTNEEFLRYLQGAADSRAFARFANDIGGSIHPHIKKRVSEVCKDLVKEELAVLERATIRAQGH